MPRLRRMHSKPVATGSLPGTYVEDASPPETSPDVYQRFLRMIPEVRIYVLDDIAASRDKGEDVTEELLTRMIDAAERRYESETQTVTPEP